MLFWFRMGGVIYTIVPLPQAYMFDNKSYFFSGTEAWSNKKTFTYREELASESIKTAKQDYDCNIIGVVTDNEKKMELIRKKKLKEEDNT